METALILYFVPLFLILMVIEVAYGFWIQKNTYRLNDAISSLSQGVISQAVAICTPFFQIGAYQFIYGRFGNLVDVHFWGHWQGWVAALLLYDFIDYWLHRFSHHCAFFWGAHVIHHQSQLFNLSTALRQESLYPVVGCFFFFPMAVLGIPPLEFAVISVFVLVYQFWIHTEHIGRLGWFDKVFSSPSNHRVHHAVNDEYINKNFGAVFIFWDRLFGTYQTEGSKCVYGTKTPLNSWDPIRALTAFYVQMLKHFSSAKGLSTKCKSLYADPAWSPDGLPNDPVPKDVLKAQTYNPPFADHGKLLSVGLLLLAFAIVCAFIAYEENLGWVAKSLGLVAVLLILKVAGRLMENTRRSE